jgi:hypothetical protein
MNAGARSADGMPLRPNAAERRQAAAKTPGFLPAFCQPHWGVIGLREKIEYRRTGEISRMSKREGQLVELS